MMNMLQAGGVPIVTDEQRTADDDNPKGYFELERVKQLSRGDVAWVDEAHGKGYVARKLHPMMACTFLESELMTPTLKELIEVSALPLRTIETTFAPDSTGFSTR